MTEFRGFSRRQFLSGLGAASFLAACPERAIASRPSTPLGTTLSLSKGRGAFLTSFHELAASERKRVKIRDVQVMVMQGASRNYTLVKITSDAGQYGIAEAYGSPGVGVKEQVLSLKPWLWGKIRWRSTSSTRRWEKAPAI